MHIDPIVLSVWLEKFHRYVFDNIYVQHSERFPFRRPFTKRELIILFLYRHAIKLNPSFRSDLRARFPKDKAYQRYPLLCKQ